MKIETTDGKLVNDDDKYTQEQAEADVKDRNERAAQLGIKTRYRIREP